MADRDRLRDMAESLDKIARHRPSSLHDLLDDEVLSTAMIRWIEVVGEAAANVSAKVRSAHPELPWRDVIAMRNQLIHAYPDIDLQLVWEVIDRDGPVLRAAIATILESLGE